MKIKELNKVTAVELGTLDAGDVFEYPGCGYFILTTQHEENDKQVVSLSSGGVDYLNGHVNVIPHVVELSILE